VGGASGVASSAENRDRADRPLNSHVAYPFEDLEVFLNGESCALRRCQGNGRPIVLLHPLALNRRIWDVTREQLVASRPAIAFDLRGHGKSRWNGSAFTIDDMASDVVAVLASLQIAQCDIVGMSMGGCVAMAIAAAWPDLVRNVVLCDTTAWYGPNAIDAWEERARSAEKNARLDLIPFQLKRWFSEDFRERCPEVVQHTVDAFLDTDPLVHAQACRALGAFDARPALQDIRAKTFIVTGKEDYATPPSMGSDLADSIEGATFSIWRDVRHFSLLESQSLRVAVAEFLSSD
jgi:3-oxoadipate enol-lactonase